MEQIKIENGRQTGYMVNGKVLRVIRDLSHYYTMEEIKTLADTQGVEEIVIYDREPVGISSHTCTKMGGAWKNGYWFGEEFVVDSWEDKK